MSELIVIDQETGEEAELLATGTFEELSEVAAEIAEEADDNGYPVPWLRVQPAE